MSDQPTRSFSLRSVIAALLVLLVVILTPVTLVARFISHEFTDSDHYVATVAPLAKNPAVQDAVARRTSKEIMARVPTDMLINQALQAMYGDQPVPPTLAQGSATIGAILEDEAKRYVESTVQDVVRSPQFADFWKQGNRQAHGHLIALLTGENTGKVRSDNGVVSVDLGAVILAVKNQLLGQDFAMATLIPNVSVHYTIFQSKHLVQAQQVMRILDRNATWLPFVTAGLLALALGLSHSRRRLLARAAAGVAFSLLLLAGGLALARTSYLEALPISAKSLPAAEEVFDTLLHPLQQAMWITFAVSLVVALGAWLVRRRTT